MNTLKDIQTKIESSVKPKLKKIGDTVQQVDYAHITRQDIADVLALCKSKEKADRQKHVKDFLDKIDNKIFSQDDKNKILNDLESYE